MTGQSPKSVHTIINIDMTLGPFHWSHWEEPGPDTHKPVKKENSEPLPTTSVFCQGRVRQIIFQAKTFPS